MGQQDDEDDDCCCQDLPELLPVVMLGGVGVGKSAITIRFVSVF